jgi:hypothetical protein
MAPVQSLVLAMTKASTGTTFVSYATECMSRKNLQVCM